MAGDYRGLDAVLALLTAQPERVEVALGAVFDADPSHAVAGRLLGWILVRGGRTEEAEALLRRHAAAQTRLREPAKAWARRRVLLGWEVEEAVAGLDPLTRESLLVQAASRRGEVPGRRAEAFRTRLRRSATLLREADDGVPEAERHLLLRIAEMLGGARRVALVGNGPGLLGAGRGAEIDAQDLVVRCNFPPVAGREADVGWRTDLVVFNDTVRAGLPRRRGEHGAVLALGLHHDHRRDGGDAPLDGLQATLPTALRRLLVAASYDCATTGLLAAHLLGPVLGLRVTLFGFDAFADPGQSHYFGAQRGAFLGHELDWERWQLSCLSAGGPVT